MPITSFPINTVPPTATIITSTPASVVTATNVQTAINQLAALVNQLQIDVGGAGTSPGGAAGNVQFNNGGAFGGLTDTQLTARINAFTDALNGSVPLSGGGDVNFLRADGAWAAPPGGSALGWITPQDFGAIAEFAGSSQFIDQTDIDAHTEWIGIYDIGTHWDVVGLQEAIYNCFCREAAFFTHPPVANAVRVQPGLDIVYGDPNTLVDGNTTGGGVTLASRSGFTGTTVVGKNINFFFKAGPTVITEAKWYQSNAASHGTWQWQGSNDFNTETSWVNIGSTFTLGSVATQTQTTLSGNVTAYSWYRLIGISGNCASTSVYEIEFKQDGAYVTGIERGVHLVWTDGDVSSGGSVKTLYLPMGNYTINRPILMVAQQFSIIGEARGESRLLWYGHKPDSVMFTADAISYGTWTNLTMKASSPVDTLMEMNGSSFYPGLHTQQVTFYDTIVFGDGNARSCITVARVGGNAAQGDTVVFVNPYIAGSINEGLATYGQNALSIKIVGGDFQGHQRNGIACHVGFVLVDGTSFQSQALPLYASPPINQIINDGADYRVEGGQGSTNIGTLKDIRSESDVFYSSDVVNTTIENCALATAGFNDAYRSYPFLIGHLVHPSTNNTKSRSFVVVGDSGDSEFYPYGWRQVDIGLSGGTTWVDNSGAAYLVNQWAGFAFHRRFGSNGFTEHTSITSNTVNTFTLGASLGGTPNAAMLYHVGGYTNNIAPNFDTAADGRIIYTGGVGQGFSITVGSNVVTGSSQIGNMSPGDSVIIPYGKYVGVPPAYVTQTAYIATVVAPPGPTTGPWTMDKIAGGDVTFGGGYWGTPIQDNQIFMLHVPYAAARNALSIHNSYFAHGRITNGGDMHSVGIEAKAQGLGNWTNEYESLRANIPASTISNTVSQRKSELYRSVYYLEAAQNGTIDLTSWFAVTDVFSLTPNGNITFNAPLPPTSRGVNQRKTFHITTQGTTSYSVTFGTNFIAQGPIITGTVADMVLSITFESSNLPINSNAFDNTWREVSRSPVNGVPTTVALLPTVGIKNRRRFVTDANATTFQSIVAGGGANNVPVFDDGTNWRIG